MSVLSGKKVLLAVTGGIAAYKAPNLVRLFKKLDAEVKVIMTTASKDFTTSLTLSTLSKNPVYSHFYENEQENKLWNNHVELSLWADFMLIAPATAHTLSKMANGVCDNLVLATYLSAKCPVYFAPAMDLDMYKHPSTKISIEKLQAFGNTLIPAAFGELASGLLGQGRMAEPEIIIDCIEKSLVLKLPLTGKKVLITAGPTHELIDPVRFIGNNSTGKMGFEMAKTAAKLGAEVILVAGPTSQQVKHKLIKQINICSADDMYKACHQCFERVDIAILAAAVADYQPKNIASQKIKKKDINLTLELKPTKDILKSLGKVKRKQLLIGFALETHNELENAKSKIKQKNLDFIVLNSLRDKGAGFATDTNKITLIDSEFKCKEFELKSKKEVSEDIFNEIIQKLNV
ncbi:MAG: bifunctional phosphopantothenoylcysteine decarboxylase/phosphopantothenate--cysteine ligase CoaBC [Tenacibaculum sp.]